MIQTAAQTTVKALLSETTARNIIMLFRPINANMHGQKNQWDNLFDDLTDNDKGYFLGSLICILDGNVGDSIKPPLLTGNSV